MRPSDRGRALRLDLRPAVRLDLWALTVALGVVVGTVAPARSSTRGLPPFGLGGSGGSSRSKPRAIWFLHKSAFLYHRKHSPHGPLNLYSVAVLLDLAARALLKLAASATGRILKPS